MSTTETITMIRQTIEHYLKKCDADIPAFAIYPFGKDGLFVKNVLNNQFGIKEKYLVDNTLCSYNSEVISSTEMLKKEEKFTVIISTASKVINDHICEEIIKSGNTNISIINIVDHIVYIAKQNDPYFLELKELLRIKAVKGHSFTRIGRFYDGGYAMIDDFSSDMKAYSFGINDDMSWDIHICEMTGMRVNMYDHTILGPPQFHKGCFFYRKGLGSVDDEEQNLLSLRTILEMNGDIDEDRKLIMKMDIENAEWDVLNSMPGDVLGLFSQMVFEFHEMTDDDTDHRMKKLRVLKKLNETHQAVWVHGNNYTHAVRMNEILFPDAIEVLYLNRKYYSFERKKIQLPLSIDMPNMCDRKDYDLSFLSY